MNGQKYLEVVCRSCGHRVVVGLSAMLAQLHSEGLLKRAKDPDADLVRELYTSRVAQLPCPTCHATRLTWQPLEDEDGVDWDNRAAVRGVPTANSTRTAGGFS